MKVAVVGSGIAGLASAWFCQRAGHQVTVFEADDRWGGHIHTHAVPQRGRTLAVDTGFIVCNDRTYPNFLALCRHLGAALRPTTMSFSVQDEATGLEWEGSSMNGLFAQRRNLLRPSFIGMTLDILKFNKAVPRLLEGAEGEIPLGRWCRDQGLGQSFIDHYLVPFGGAIWSSPPQVMLEFPARFFARFVHNHGMDTVGDRPQWFTVVGGSRAYAEGLRAALPDLRINAPVTRVGRVEGGVAVVTPHGEERFDEVVLACHADTALGVIADATPAERQILGSFPYQENTAVLHTDVGLMPRSRRAWAAWNAHCPRGAQARVAVTYDMTCLQGLPEDQGRYFVTLNHAGRIAPERIIRSLTYHHPLFTTASPGAQARHGEINGVRGLRFAGAYWRFGFHEDGLVSAMQAVAGLADPVIPGSVA